MSIRVITRVWDTSPYDGSALLLHLALADFANDSDMACWPSVATLAKMCRRSERHVTRLLTQMQEDGVIERIERPGTSNVYKLKRKKEWTLGDTHDTHVTPTSTPATPDTHVSPPLTPMSDDPSLNHHLTESLSKTAKAPLPEIPGDYTVTYHYKDRDNVGIIGKAMTGPWQAYCPACKVPMRIEALDTATECLCGMKEIVVTRTKPRVRKARYSEAIEIYYGIVRSRGVKYGSMDEWHSEIASTVYDMDRWRQVVKEYISQSGAGGKPWSALSVDRMLTYYREERMPGSRKKREKKDLTSAETANYTPAEQKSAGEGQYETVMVDGKAVVRLVEGS